MLQDTSSPGSDRFYHSRCVRWYQGTRAVPRCRSLRPLGWLLSVQLRLFDVHPAESQGVAAAADWEIGDSRRDRSVPTDQPGRRTLEAFYASLDLDAPKHLVLKLVVGNHGDLVFGYGGGVHESKSLMSNLVAIDVAADGNATQPKIEGR